jgi:hypothetical protein
MSYEPLAAGQQQCQNYSVSCDVLGDFVSTVVTEIKTTATDFPSRCMSLSGRIWGHLWTIGSALLASLYPQAVPPSRRFETVLRDLLLGPVRLTGLLSEIAGSETILLIVQALSGNALSPYCARAARAAVRTTPAKISFTAELSKTYRRP